MWAVASYPFSLWAPWEKSRLWAGFKIKRSRWLHRALEADARFPDSGEEGKSLL